MLEERLREILNSYSGDIIIVTNPLKEIVWVNNWFTNLTGYSFEEAKGQNPGTLLQGKETDPKTVEKMRAALNAEEKFNVNIVNYSKEGEKYWLNISCSPVFDKKGNLEFFIAIERDITSIYEKNQKKLNSLIEEQQRLSDEKSKLIEFVYLLTHDLKAPVNNIERLIELCNLEEDSEIKEMILSEVSRLRTLINKILPSKNRDIRKVDLDVNPFNIYKTLSTLIKNNTSYLKENNLTAILKCEEDVQIKTDKVIFTQVIENLFVNAIKYANTNSHINFEVSLKKENILFVISNETDALEDWKIKKLFTPFQNFDAGFSKKSTGIGSYIVKRYLGLLGGDITVTKNDNRVFFNIMMPKEL